MAFILDGIVAAIIIIITVITVKKGFVKSILSVASLVLTLLIISSLGKPIAETIYDGVIAKPIESSITEKIEETNQKTQETVDGIWNGLPKIVTSIASNHGYNQSNIANIISSKQEAEINAKNISDNIIKPPLVSVLLIAVDVILFTALMFIFRFISLAICKLFKAPVLNKVNAFLGFLLGLVKGVAIAVIACSLITALAGVSKDGQFFLFSKDVIDKTYLFKEFSSLFGLFDFV